MEHNQNTIAAINHQRAMRIKFHDHSWLFHQSLQKVAVVERLWQLGTGFSGCCHCRDVTIVKRFKQESMYGLSAGTKKRGHCREVAVSGDSTVLSLLLLFEKKKTEKKETKQSILLRFSRCFILMYCFYRTNQNQHALKQIDPEDGVTVVFHVLLEKFLMAEERLHIRAGARDLGEFRINCVDLTSVG